MAKGLGFAKDDRWRDEAHDEMRPRWDDREKDWKRDYSDEDGVVEVERDYTRLKKKYMSQGVSEEEFDAWWAENFEGPDGSSTYQARDPEFFAPKKHRTGGRF